MKHSSSSSPSAFLHRSSSQSPDILQSASHSHQQSANDNAALAALTYRTALGGVECWPVHCLQGESEEARGCWGGRGHGGVKEEHEGLDRVSWAGSQRLMRPFKSERHPPLSLSLEERKCMRTLKCTNHLFGRLVTFAIKYEHRCQNHQCVPKRSLAPVIQDISLACVETTLLTV